jgi:hypothetical protein
MQLVALICLFFSTISLHGATPPPLIRYDISVVNNKKKPLSLGYLSPKDKMRLAETIASSRSILDKLTPSSPRTSLRIKRIIVWSLFFLIMVGITYGAYSWYQQHMGIRHKTIESIIMMAKVAAQEPLAVEASKNPEVFFAVHQDARQDPEIARLADELDTSLRTFMQTGTQVLGLSKELAALYNHAAVVNAQQLMEVARPIITDAGTLATDYQALARSLLIPPQTHLQADGTFAQQFPSAPSGRRTAAIEVSHAALAPFAKQAARILVRS